MLLAVRADGLPIGYLLTHVEFADIVTLGKRTFWIAANPNGRRVWFSARSLSLYVFAGFVAILCLTANLMGPATAVLVPPSLGWTELQFPTGGKFDNTSAADPPRPNYIAYGCNSSAPGNYT